MLSSPRIYPVLVGLFVAAVLAASPAMAHGHAGRSTDCLFQIEQVKVQIEDLSDGVLLTMTSSDEEAISRLRERAWKQVESEDGAREHDCFFNRPGVQALVKEVHDGVVLTITSADEETIAELQEIARRTAEKGCRHGSHHDPRR